MITRIEKRRVCLHQLYPHGRMNQVVDGKGNCFDCEADERNKECSGYRPVNVWDYVVVDRSKE